MSYVGYVPAGAPITFNQIKPLTDPLYQRIDNTSTPNDIFKNALINGSFDIWQRALSFTSSGVFAQYTADRWIGANLGPNGSTGVTLQNFGTADIASESVQFLRISTAGHSGASDAGYLQQVVEGVRRFAGKRVVIRGMIRRPAGAGNVSFELGQSFGTGGSASNLTYAGTVTPTAVWTPFQLFVNVPALNSSQTIGSNSGLSLVMFASAGSNYNARSNNLGLQTITIDLADMELKEVIPGYGDQVPGFERLPFATEYYRCLRYFELGQYNVLGAGNANWYLASTMPFLCPKRVVPTVTATTSSTNANINAVVIQPLGSTHMRAYTTSTAASAYTEWGGTYSANAEI